MLGKEYCYPLTITDYHSRYLLGCDRLTSIRSDIAFTVFEHTCKGFGLPAPIRTDNSVPLCFQQRPVTRTGYDAPSRLTYERDCYSSQ